ncbi:MAG: acyltransferase 3 [Solirubrobacterales bacterium]|nr:acyltransferase 3 [Solirubrobacterales bacterium]
MAAEVSAQGGERVSQAGEQRLARVESMRALAAVSVVIGHLWATAHGFDHPDYILGTLPRRMVFGLTYGVWVFFGLTGYLLFWPFVRRQFNSGGAIDLRRYAYNRALRILPLYYVAVVFLLLFQVPDPTRRMWWRHLLLLQNFWRDSIGDVDAPIWSVVVEVQFYALLPLLAWGIFKVAGRSRRHAFAVLAVLGIASMVARQVLALWADNPALELWRFELPTTFGFFAAGMSVALLRSAWEERRPAFLDGPLGAPWLWLAAAVPLWIVMCWRFSYENLSALGVFLIVGAMVLPLRPWSGLRVFDFKPLALLGVVSYSLYVWHAPIILALDGGRTINPHGFPAVLAVFLPLLVAVAAVSYLIIERPALKLRRRWAPTSPAQEGSAP